MGVVRVLARIDIRERLAIGIADLKATGYFLDRPWWRESSFGHIERLYEGSAGPSRRAGCPGVPVDQDPIARRHAWRTAKGLSYGWRRLALAFNWIGHRGDRCRHDVRYSHMALWAKEASDSFARQLSPSILIEKAPIIGGTGKPSSSNQRSADRSRRPLSWNFVRR